ncbi:MAG: hypothetical protein HGB11_11910 [Chlorobiales bacterium]|nr:hypothetical protein [Chlorobiales bacterium]
MTDEKKRVAKQVQFYKESVALSFPRKRESIEKLLLPSGFPIIPSGFRE